MPSSVTRRDPSAGSTIRPSARRQRQASLPGLLVPVLACLGAALAALLPMRAAACGTAETVCTVEGGEYRLVLPASGEGPAPALLYLHGWGASPAGVLSGRGAMVDRALARGYAVVLPQGLPRAGRTQRDWDVSDGRPHPRDDVPFLAAVLDDAAGRGIDRDRVLMAGFSRGGSMVWDAFCRMPGLAAAYAPVAGAFWVPGVEGGCADGRLAVWHVHGWGDRVVPIEGRPIGTILLQGDVFDSLATLRTHLGCDARQPDTAEAGATPRWTRSWTGCQRGRIDLTLHPGGHTVPEGWTEEALDWFEARLSETATR